MSLFRLVEGIISTRPTNALGDFATDGVQAVATDVAFDFGGLRKDIHIECDQPVTVKFNTSASPAINVASGVWNWTGEFATKAFVSFTTQTNFRMQANG